MTAERKAHLNHVLVNLERLLKSVRVDILVNNKAKWVDKKLRVSLRAIEAFYVEHIEDVKKELAGK